MIIEQIRYFLGDADRAQVLEIRRTIDRLRQGAGVPAGKILLADEGSESGPELIWQCGYEDEGEMGMAEAALLGNPEYEQARADLGSTVEHVELEIYLSDEE